MTEYSDMIETKRKQLAAEEWALGIKDIHAHSLKSMWYEKWPNDTDNGGVVDTTYNDGTIERKLADGGTRIIRDETLTGQALIESWEAYNVSQSK